MSESPHRPRLTIEDLLRLKRAERPAPEFWTRFEHSLREKQLAALLHRRPWWHTALQSLTRRGAFLPLGATAVIAGVFFSVKYLTPPGVTPGGAQAVALAEAPAVLPTLKSAVEPQAIPVMAVAAPAAVPSDAIASTTLSASLPERASELTPWSAPVPADRTSTPSMATVMTELDRADPEMDQSYLNGRFFAVAGRPHASNATTTELASVTALTSKRSRLLAQFGDRYYAPEPQAPKILRDRQTRQLADTDFNDRFSRIGLKGDQVSLKF